jgi:hypothetical protein
LKTAYLALLVSIIVDIAPRVWVAGPNLLGATAIAAAASADTPRLVATGFASTQVYRQEAIQGFTVLIHPEVLQHPPDAKELRQELHRQLAAIARVLPPRRLAALRQVPIWVEWAKRPQGAAEFHPSADWLRQNGYNPQKADAVEISNSRNFVQWSRRDQPWMIMHELAHAYHHRVLGDNHGSIITAYNHAVQQKRYASVAYIQGGNRKAYALTNAKEYFAELTEAYWGKNDFYPFNRAQLKTYDPIGYRLMQTVWGQ